MSFNFTHRCSKFAKTIAIFTPLYGSIITHAYFRWIIYLCVQLFIKCIYLLFSIVHLSKNGSIVEKQVAEINLSLAAAAAP